jgi:hypothetical protein
VILFKLNFFEAKEKEYFGKVINEFCVNDKCYKRDGQNLRQEIMKTTLDRWQTIKIIGIVSTNKEKFQGLGFMNEKVILKINGKELEIGNISSDYLGTLVKKPGEEVVYKIDVIIDKNNINDQKYWTTTE